MVQKNWVVLAIARKVGNTSRETTIYVLLVLVSDPNFFSVQIVRAILFHTNRHTFELLVTLQNRRNVLRFSLGRTGAQSECKGHVTCAKKKSHYFRVRASVRDQIITSFHVHVRCMDVLKTSIMSSLPISTAFS